MMLAWCLYPPHLRSRSVQGVADTISIEDMLRLGVIQTRLLYIMHHVCICLWHVQKHINSISNLKSPWDQPCRPPRLLLRHWPPAASTANCGGTGAVGKATLWDSEHGRILRWLKVETRNIMASMTPNCFALHVSQNHLQGGLRLLANTPVRVLGCFHGNSNGCPWCLLCISDSPIRSIEESLQILTGWQITQKHSMASDSRIVTDERWQKKM